MRLTVHMAGLDKLSLQVKYLIESSRRGLAFGANEAASLIVERAKELVPVDTGNLRDHIHQETLVDEPERQIVQVAPMVQADNKWGFDPAYARRIEYGFVGQDSLGRYYNQAAQPYMRPAFDELQEQAAQTIKTSVFEEMDAAMAGVSQRQRSGRAKGQG